MKFHPASLCAALLLPLAAGANAQILVANTATANNAAANSSSITISGFNLNSGNALVVVVNSEANNGTGTPAYSVTFGGMAVTSNVFINQGAQGAGVFYWLNPSTISGDIVVTLNGASTLDRAAVSVLSLSNVLAVGDTQTGVATNGGASGVPTISLTYNGTADGFVVAGFVDNASATGTTPTITGGNIDTTLQSLPNNSSGGSAGIIQSYGDIVADGSFTVDFKASRDGTNSTRNAAALVAFTAVPEPSTAILAGVGFASLLWRARRRPTA